jgi:hypothetical protein
MLRLGVLMTVAGGCNSTAKSGAATSAVIDGDPLAGTDRLVYLSTPACDGGGHDICTGTLINNEWVLSAQHCGYACNPPSETVASFAGNSYLGARIVSHPSLDLVLIKLNNPVSVNGSTSGFQSSLYTYTSESLIGQEVAVQGFGDNSCDGTGYGTLRTGEMLAVGGDQYNNQYDAINGQSAGSGDSGGPLWKFWNGVPFQIGITKAGACGSYTWASRPEVFEQWVFDVVYNAPIHVPTTDEQGRGLWFVSGPDSQLWERPLAQNRFDVSPYFTPCPDSTSPYTFTADYLLDPAGDNIWIEDGDGNFTTLSGTGRTTATGSGPMRFFYSTGATTYSLGLNWMTVQCDYGLQPAELICHGARCGTTRDPLPVGFYSATEWDPCGGGDFYYFADYDMGTGNALSVGDATYRGHGTVEWVYLPGPTTVSVQTTDLGISHGIRSLKAVCYGWDR